MYKGPNRKFKRKSMSRKRPSQFGLQLLEKQKLRAIYGIREQSLKNYYRRAMRLNENVEHELLKLLELRLDNVVYRAGFAQTRFQARQIVNHGHIVVNGRRVNIPSYQARKGDIVGIREKSRPKGVFEKLSDRLAKHQQQAWLSLDAAKATVKVLAEPQREFIMEPVDPSLVIEFYSR